MFRYQIYSNYTSVILIQQFYLIEAIIAFDTTKYVNCFTYNWYVYIVNVLGCQT